MISVHQIRVYEVVRDGAGWLSGNDIAKLANVAPRTARAHAANLTAAGVFERQEIFGGYLYRLLTPSTVKGRQFIATLDAARAAMGASHGNSGC